MKKDLRYFLACVKEKAPEQFLRVKKEVDPRWELSSVQRRLQDEGRLPILLFEKVKNQKFQVVTNLFSSRQLVEIALDTTPDGLVKKLVYAQNNRIKSRLVDSGPAKDVVLEGDKADLGRLPIVTHCEKDAGAYITAGVMIIRDPSTGLINAGIYRHKLLGSKRLTANLAPLSHASKIAAEAEKEGKTLDAAIVLGHHPALGIASQYHGELGESELDVMGGLLGESVEMVRCATSDLPVPADAEIVIEGKIRPGVRDTDGPFGDYWLYYTPAREARVFEVTAITHRNDAIYHDIFNVGPEHIILFTLGIEAFVLPRLKELIPQVKAIHIPVSGSGNLVYVQIAKDYEGLGANAALAVLGIHRFKCAIVVDDDIDIRDDGRVIWAVVTRTQADRSFFNVPGSYVSRVDPAAYPAWHSSSSAAPVLSTRLGIDATKPLGRDFPEVAEPPRKLTEQIDLSKLLGG
jgi:2,5-furandicarboxylate decarboxylase 1